MIETRDFHVDRFFTLCLIVPVKFQRKTHAENAMPDVDKSSRGCSEHDLSTAKARQEEPATPSGRLSGRHRHRHRFRPDYLAAAAAIFGLILTPAHAADLYQKAEAEARAWLVPCGEFAPQLVPACAKQQKTFVESYILSKTGLTCFMGDVVSRLDPPPRAVAPIFFRQSKPEACAWRFLRSKIALTQSIRDAYREAFDFMCPGRLSETEIAASSARLTALTNELAAGQPKLTPALRAIRDREVPNEPLTAILELDAF